MEISWRMVARNFGMVKTTKAALAPFAPPGLAGVQDRTRSRLGFEPLDGWNNSVQPIMLSK